MKNIRIKVEKKYIKALLKILKKAKDFPEVRELIHFSVDKGYVRMMATDGRMLCVFLVHSDEQIDESFEVSVPYLVFEGIIKEKGDFVDIELKKDGVVIYYNGKTLFAEHTIGFPDWRCVIPLEFKPAPVCLSTYYLNLIHEIIKCIENKTFHGVSFYVSREGGPIYIDFDRDDIFCIVMPYMRDIKDSISLPRWLK